MTSNETLDEAIDRIWDELAGMVINEISARQKRGERLSPVIRTVIEVAYNAGAEDRQPEIDELEADAFRLGYASGVHDVDNLFGEITVGTGSLGSCLRAALPTAFEAAGGEQE